MNKLTISVLALTVVVVVGGALFFGKEPQNDSQQTQAVQIENHEYYWREGCPYCDNVEEFMQSWSGKDKVVIDKKDASNRNNALLMTQRAKSCNINTSQLGVPFLVTPEGKCYIGDAPIIDYLSNL